MKLRTRIGLVIGAATIAVIPITMTACAASARGGEPVNAPVGAASYELPDGHGGSIGGWTWCSHGVRVWQTYAWEDSTNGERVLALTSQPGAGCAP